MSLLIHPGEQQRYIAPARKRVVHDGARRPTRWSPVGSSSAGTAASSSKSAIGGGVRAAHRSAQAAGSSSSRGGCAKPRGAAGHDAVAHVPVSDDASGPLPGLEVRLTPSVGVSFGFVGVPTADEPVVRAAPRAERQGGSDQVPAGRRAAAPAAADATASRLPLDAAVTWSPYGGWRFVGLGELAAAGGRAAGRRGSRPRRRREAATEVVTPLNQKLGPITLHERRLEVTTTAIPVSSATRTSACASR